MTADTAGRLISRQVASPLVIDGQVDVAWATAESLRLPLTWGLDGDGSDDAGQMQALIEPIERDEADLVLGSRVLGPAATGGLLPHQRLGNGLTTALVRLLYGQRITDLPPFKAIRHAVLAELAMREMTYGRTVEMIVKCARRGYCIVEVPVAARPRIGGQSKVSGTIKGTVLAAYYLLGTTIKYAWRD
jgi:hypothetical protein